MRRLLIQYSSASKAGSESRSWHREREGSGANGFEIFFTICFDSRLDIGFSFSRLFDGRAISECVVMDGRW
jgi:hypothetical protein